MEKAGYRDALALLLEQFPNRGGISVKEAAQFFGRSECAIYDAIKSKTSSSCGEDGRKPCASPHPTRKMDVLV